MVELRGGAGAVVAAEAAGAGAGDARGLAGGGDLADGAVVVVGVVEAAVGEGGGDGEDAAHLTQQLACDERPADVLPPRSPVDRLGGKQVEPEVAGGKQPRLDSAHGTNQHRLDIGGEFGERLGDRERGHQVAARAAAGDQDASHRARGFEAFIPSAARDLLRRRGDAAQ